MVVLCERSAVVTDS